ncbi:uncharacterized protein [Triticum aestivum]|uniref:uncharacterized protein n=1 Tax=Triticum aestivum TaxID=4565 RepID=UPI001D01AAA0|nr:uncharacterized protein LOC123068115 [Triticum aestivum]
MPPREGFSDIVRAVIELKDVIQLHLRMEENFKRKIQKLKEKRKKDKIKHEEDLRVLKEDLIRIFKEDHEVLKSKIQEMQKEACTEVNHYKASPSQRSQLSQSPKFRLAIENSVSRTIYKKDTVETEDGGGHIKVGMYDGANPIPSDHPLASVRVDLVLVEGSFNEPKQDFWSKEEFDESIIKPRKGIKRLVENSTFNLIDGSCDHEGVSIMDNSQQREVKLGVRLAVHTGVRVLEGVSNPFKVQEGKTKSLGPVSLYFLFPKRVSPDEQHGLPPPIIQGPFQKADRVQHTEEEDNGPSYPPVTMPPMVEANGQALNINIQQSSQHIPTPILWQSTSTHSMQPSMPNPLQVAGYCPPLPPCGQDQCTSLPNAIPQVTFPNLSGYGLLDGQWNTNPGGEMIIEHENRSNVQLPVEEYYLDASFRCNQVLIQWDEPHVELKKHRTFLDQLMPLYSTQSRFNRESLPGMRVMDKADKLLASISYGDSVWKMVTSITSRSTQTPQRRGVLIRLIKPYDSDDGPPVKKQRNARYQLRFVNRVCNDYYTREQIKSEDGNLLKVALYDENNLVVTSGPLSSASVEIVLLHGDFNDEGRDYWTSEEFSACLVHPQSVEEPTALGGDRVLTLAEGGADLGNVNFHTSSSHARTGKFKMGVKITNLREESVQEGITSPFLVRVRQGKGLMLTGLAMSAVYLLGLISCFYPAVQHLIRKAPHFSVDCVLCGCLVFLGHDLFMYNDAAFCSMECRQQHITHDERKKKCTARSMTHRCTRPWAPDPDG